MSNVKATFVSMQSQIEPMNYISSSFDPSRKQSYHLFIDGSVGEDPLLLFLNGQHHLEAVLGYAQYQADYGHSPLESLHLNAATLIVPALDLTLIPHIAYDPGLQDEYAYHILDDGISKAQTIDFMQLKAKGVYREHSLSILEFTKLLPGAARRLLQHGLLETMSGQLNKGAISHATVLGMHLMGERIFYYLFKQGNLIYFNDYQFFDLNQLNYHLIKIANLSGEAIHDMELYLSGTTMPDDEVYHEVKDYFKTIHYLVKPDEIAIVLPDALKGYEHRLFGFFGAVRPAVEG